MSTIVAILVLIAVSILMTLIRASAATTQPITYIGSAYTEKRTNDPGERTYDLADDAV